MYPIKQIACGGEKAERRTRGEGKDVMGWDPCLRTEWVARLQANDVPFSIFHRL